MTKFQTETLPGYIPGPYFSSPASSARMETRIRREVPEIER